MVSNSFKSKPQGIHQPYTNTMGTSSEDNGGVTNGGVDDTQLSSLLCNISMLKDKLNRMQSMASLPIFSSRSMETVIQEIIVTASSMMFNCTQMTLDSSNSNNDGTSINKSCSRNNNDNTNYHSSHQQHAVTSNGLSQLSMVGGGKSDGHNSLSSYEESNNNTSNNNNKSYLSTTVDRCKTETTSTKTFILEEKNTHSAYNSLPTKQPHQELEYDIVELEATDLLAEYTQFCHVCGKGFKREANLRMHMRAHGDEYKSMASLRNQLKHINNEDDKSDGSSTKPSRKYSCPQQGCRRNKNNANFQPLKSMLCAKNHYKRIHCPKKYVCKRCNTKQFSIMSDLRTHEKHCGDVRWQCSCGTTFSKKDKLMGHLSLFVGHIPIINDATFSSNNINCQLGL